MENETSPEFTREAEQKMLEEILVNTRKTKNYMKWQLIITVALVVIPLLGLAALIPMVFKSLGSVYGSGVIPQ